MKMILSITSFYEFIIVLVIIFIIIVLLNSKKKRVAKKHLDVDPDTVGIIQEYDEDNPDPYLNLYDQDQLDIDQIYPTDHIDPDDLYD